MHFFPCDVFQYFASDAQKIVEQDFKNFPELLEKELQAKRQLKNNNANKIAWPRSVSQLDSAQLNQLAESVFLNWMHYKVAKITPIPRNVRASKKIHQLAKWIPNILEIMHDLEVGNSVSDRGSRRLFGSNRLRDARKDYLFWHFGIAHLHMSQYFLAPEKRLGSKDVLLLYVDHKDAVLLDLVQHDFKLTGHLIALLKETAPEIAERYRLQGVTGLSRDVSQDELSRQLRRGINTPVKVGNDYYMAPGSGMTSSMHSLRVLTNLDDVIHAAYDQCISHKLPENELKKLRLAFDGQRLLLEPRTNKLGKTFFGPLLF